MAANRDGMLYVTSGLLWDISGERLAVLEACNDHNVDYATPAMFLHQDEDETGRPWRQGVLLQQKHPVPLLQAVPPFFKSALDMMPALTDEARGRLADNAVQGRKYKWREEETQMLLQQSVF